MQLSHLAVLSITTLIPLISASLLPETVNLALSSPLSKRGPGGWNKVTYPKGSAEDNIPVQDGTLQLFAMTKKGQDKTLLKRVIFVIHGEVSFTSLITGFRSLLNYYREEIHGITTAT
jgi:hypothetical protein